MWPQRCVFGALSTPWATATRLYELADVSIMGIVPKKLLLIVLLPYDISWGVFHGVAYNQKCSTTESEPLVPTFKRPHLSKPYSDK